MNLLTIIVIAIGLSMDAFAVAITTGATYKKYGPPEVLHIEQVEKPIPKNNEVLVKVCATTVHVGDTIMRKGKHPDSKLFTIAVHFMMGLRKPRTNILGMELAGEIEAVGKDVTKFKPGDQVFASTFHEKYGGYAEYKCLSENGYIALKPKNISLFIEKEQHDQWGQGNLSYRLNTKKRVNLSLSLGIWEPKVISYEAQKKQQKPMIAPAMGPVA